MRQGSPDGWDRKESDCNAGELGSISGLGKSPGEGNGYPLQYSCLENSIDRGAWWATVHGVIKSHRDWVTNTGEASIMTEETIKFYNSVKFTKTSAPWDSQYYKYPWTNMEEEMATDSIILAWRIPLTEEPGVLQSMSLPRVGHGWATKHSSTWLN